MFIFTTTLMNYHKYLDVMRSDGMLFIKFNYKILLRSREEINLPQPRRQNAPQRSLRHKIHLGSDPRAR